jgi:hypothetical protein
MLQSFTAIPYKRRNYGIPHKDGTRCFIPAGIHCVCGRTNTLRHSGTRTVLQRRKVGTTAPKAVLTYIAPPSSLYFVNKMASLGMCCRHVYKTWSEDDSQSRTDLLLSTSLHLSCTLSTTQCAFSRTPTNSCTIIYFGVQVTVLLHIGIAANSTTASISGSAVSVARSQHQILMTSLHVSHPTKENKSKMSRPPVTSFYF